MTNSELQLDQEQKDIAMTIDMDIACRAAVFIGNGVRLILEQFAHTNSI